MGSCRGWGWNVHHVPDNQAALLARQMVDELIYGERGNDVLLVKYLEEARQAA